MHSLARLAALLALTASTTGCVFWAPTLTPIGNELAASAPGARMKPQVALRAGRLSLAIARGVLNGDESDEDSRAVGEILRHVNAIEVAVYEAETVSASARAALSKRLDRLATRRGWHLAARFNDTDATGAVIYQGQGSDIRGVVLVALEEDSMVLVRFRGDLDEALAGALALHGREIQRDVVPVPDATGETAGGAGI